MIHPILKVEEARNKLAAPIGGIPFEKYYAA
jgi:hypothetical protein